MLFPHMMMKDLAGKTILLAVWEDHGDQAEALINIHAIRENNVVVHNFAQ